MTSTIKHGLPDDPGSSKTDWFTNGQNKFEQSVIRQQVAFKRSRWPDMADGQFSKKPSYTYPHIMPAGNEQLAFYDGFGRDVLIYMKTNEIAIHSEILNLKSSQAACINFLFPLLQTPSLAPSVLQKLLPDIETLDRLEFEYTGQDGTSTSCTEWLGEPMSGKRGQNRTGIDAALFWTDKAHQTHISLIEWKYTERSFGSCSAFWKADKAGKASCRDLDTLDCPSESCLLSQPGRNRGRQYWEHMAEAGIDLAKLQAVEECPFQGPFYQLMRQFLVAQFLRNSRAADHVEVVSLDFDGNQALKTVPKQLRPLCAEQDDSVVDAWNSILESVPPMRCISAEQLLAGYDRADGVDAAWRQYIRDRYGM